MNIKENILYILNNEIKPAVGCTEPVAIALCAAATASCININNIDHVDVYLSANIYKNGMNVGIPNSDDTGLDVAASLGISIHNYDHGLQILADIDENNTQFAKKLISENKISVMIADTPKKVYIKTIIKSGADIATAIIEDKHDNITFLLLNEKKLIKKNSETSNSNTSNPTNMTVDEDFFNVPIKDIISEIEKLDFEDTKYMLEGIKMNMAAANKGLEKKYGLGVGYSIKQNMDKGLICKDFANTALMLTAAASDARMSGLNIPVMSSSGSGNNGLTAILPLAAYQSVYNFTDDIKMSKALAISHVITSYVKHYIGRLSPLCGCSIAAATGSACAITWLLGGNNDQIQGTIKNILANLSGVICDGAKPGCSFKLATAAASGVQASLLAMSGCVTAKNNGIVVSSAEQSIKSLKTLSEIGMTNVDKTIIKIMSEAN